MSFSTRAPGPKASEALDPGETSGPEVWDNSLMLANGNGLDNA